MNCPYCGSKNKLTLRTFVKCLDCPSFSLDSSVSDWGKYANRWVNMDELHTELFKPYSNAHKLEISKVIDLIRKR